MLFFVFILSIVAYGITPISASDTSGEGLNSNGQLYCAQCTRIFKTKFGFVSHIRAQQKENPG